METDIDVEGIAKSAANEAAKVAAEDAAKSTDDEATRLAAAETDRVAAEEAARVAAAEAGKIAAEEPVKAAATETSEATSGTPVSGAPIASTSEEVRTTIAPLQQYQRHLRQEDPTGSPAFSGKTFPAHPLSQQQKALMLKRNSSFLHPA